MRRAHWQLLLAGALVALASAPARAQKGEDPGYRLKLVMPRPKPGPDGKPPPAQEPPPDPSKLRPGDPPPMVRAVAAGRVGLTPKDFVLKQSDAQPPLVIEPVKAVPYRESDEPLALVVLVQGNFRWIGNETYKNADDPDDQGSIYDGAFKGLGPAIDVLAKAGPPGSKASLMVYAERQAIAKQAMGDATALSGGALGSQQDYGENVSQPLIIGLTEAWKALANMGGYRKVLVVIGDGMDDRADAGNELKKVTGDLKEAGVEVYTIFYNPQDDGPQGQQNMAKIGLTSRLTANSRDDFTSLAGTVLEAINAKYYVDFPGDKIKFDGAEHEFILAVGGEDRPPQSLQLPTLVKPVEEGGSLWWVWLLVVVLLVVLLIVIILIVRRRPVEEPMPLAPPPPLGPMKTIMIGVGGIEDSIPVVGWVVPLAGPNQFQTFKLQQGATKLGTGGESHILIGDGYMSAEHAEIVCTASGFVINDLGSTNGVFVNARRVSSQELVDNDVFKLGATDFKFKSIN
ncbi:MAG TPA: FHA domain-containing protein [Kofleriaceae bacterium]|nr:FHA domain-containing protein [Kofleriaceae bacterium]